MRPNGRIVDGYDTAPGGDAHTRGGLLGAEPEYLFRQSVGVYRGGNFTLDRLLSAGGDKEIKSRDIKVPLTQRPGRNTTPHYSGIDASDLTPKHPTLGENDSTLRRFAFIVDEEHEAMALAKHNALEFYQDYRDTQFAFNMQEQAAGMNFLIFTAEENLDEIGGGPLSWGSLGCVNDDGSALRPLSYARLTSLMNHPGTDHLQITAVNCNGVPMTYDKLIEGFRTRNLRNNQFGGMLQCSHPTFIEAMNWRPNTETITYQPGAFESERIIATLLTTVGKIQLFVDEQNTPTDHAAFVIEPGEKTYMCALVDQGPMTMPVPTRGTYNQEIWKAALFLVIGQPCDHIIYYNIGNAGQLIRWPIFDL